jgi:hypothetical protein
MHARLVRLNIIRKMGATSMTKQRLIQIIVVIEIMLVATLLWVTFK